jgi:SulP family sulfate permease
MRQAWSELRRSNLGGALDPFPLRRAFKGYGKLSLLADTRAAVSVALLAIPQGMAYAVIAGLPLHYGITCSAVAGIIAPMLSSSRFTILGPTNATAFLVFSFFAAYPQLDRVGLVPLLVFLTGTLLIVGAYFRVADLAQYISRTVIVAYVTGAAVLIVMNQVPNVLGISMENSGHKPVTLPGLLYQIAAHLPQSNWSNLLVATGTLVVYAGIRKMRPAWPAFIITLVAASLAVYFLEKAHLHFDTFGSEARFALGQLLPPFPDFASPGALADLSRLFGVAMALAFLATVEQSVMAKTLASRSGHRVDQNQDMLSLGMANLACAYLSGMPASGSLTRSALNYESGARTQLAAIISGLLCLLGALTLGSLVGHIPRAALAMLVICVALSVIHRRQLRICVLSTRSDAIVFAVTFLATLMLPLHVAIFTGVGVSIVLYLRKASRPSLVEYEFNKEGQLAESKTPGARKEPAISIVHVEGELFFGAAELFRTQIQRTFADPNLRIIILRLKNARHLDATSVIALDELVRTLRSSGRDLIVSGAMKDVYRVLRDSGLVNTIGRENIFPGSPANPNISTRNALRRAQEILGTSAPDVHIYYDPSL